MDLTGKFLHTHHKRKEKISKQSKKTMALKLEVKMCVVLVIEREKFDTKLITPFVKRLSSSG